MPSFVLTINCANAEELMDAATKLALTTLNTTYTVPGVVETTAPAATAHAPVQVMVAEALTSMDADYNVESTPVPAAPTVPVILPELPAGASGQEVIMRYSGYVDLDSRGYPWDDRIHASSKAVNDDKTWRYRRNIRKTHPGLIEQVEAELRGMIAPDAGVTATPLEQAIAVAPQAPTMPAPVAPIVPTPTMMAPLQTIDPQTVTTAIAPTPVPVMPTPTAPVIPTPAEDPLAIPKFLQRTPDVAPQAQTTPVVPQAPQAPAMPAPEALAPVAPTAPVAQAVDYALVVKMLTNACKPGPNGEPPRMTNIAAFNAQVGIAGIADLASDPAKVQVAYQTLVTMGIQ